MTVAPSFAKPYFLRCWIRLIPKDTSILLILWFSILKGEWKRIKTKK